MSGSKNRPKAPPKGGGNRGSGPPLRGGGKVEARAERARVAQAAAGAEVVAASPGEMPRLQKRYLDEVRGKLRQEFGYKNPMQVPKLEKIVINMGLGEAVANAKIMDVAVGELGQIAGQRPVMTRAKKSIANFKLRQNMPIGAAVTLRGERMYEFFDRLTSVVLPRVRDFRGVSMKSFDGRGNYTLGLRDQLIFPEISYEKVDKVRGMNVTIVTTARTDDEARELLKQLGMPFRQQGV